MRRTRRLAPARQRHIGPTTPMRMIIPRPPPRAGLTTPRPPRRTSSTQSTLLRRVDPATPRGAGQSGILRLRLRMTRFSPRFPPPLRNAQAFPPAIPRRPNYAASAASYRPGGDAPPPLRVDSAAPHGRPVVGRRLLLWPGLLCQRNKWKKFCNPRYKSQRSRHLLYRKANIALFSRKQHVRAPNRAATFLSGFSRNEYDCMHEI